MLGLTTLKCFFFQYKLLTTVIFQSMHLSISASLPFTVLKKRKFAFFHYKSKGCSYFDLHLKFILEAIF